MTELTRTIPWNRDNGEFLDHEWLVTNGLGGYASGTVAGVITRRFHGTLIAALPSPYGRRMMLNAMTERVFLPDGTCADLGGEETVNSALYLHAADCLREFRLEQGLPIWTYSVKGTLIEKRLQMVYRQNTVHVTYRLVSPVSGGEGPVRIELRPAMQFRPHEGTLGTALELPYTVAVIDERYEFSDHSAAPPLRMAMHGDEAAFTFDRRRIQEVLYRIEESRGYEAKGDLWSPGYWHANLAPGRDATVVASTEPWEVIEALTPAQAEAVETRRRRTLLAQAPAAVREGIGAELVLAADQFLITPLGRVQDMARARAAGDDVRTVIAGYHWFTDWGRDTMISLPGLCLATGRHHEAAWLLRTFAYYVRDGLIPNMFPEGENHGLYHTADASLWFFQAMQHYLQATDDQSTLRAILPRLREIADAHRSGTRFHIRVDPADGLLAQGEEGYQLTWMDAKVDGWVVTPRRGKAVEINALWYNALKLLACWLREAHGDGEAQPYEQEAARVRQAFNERFWSAELGHLLDVVDGEQGDDPACRPNQLLAIALENAVLDEAHWRPVLDVCRERLLTPVGLRSLAPGHPDYKDKYFGDLRSRDAAYHQGTVWGWLIGPYVDAYLRVHPEDRAGARQLLEGYRRHLDEACVGSISEVFDATEPFTPRACVAQAWSVAEVLRCWLKTAG